MNLRKINIHITDEPRVKHMILVTGGAGLIGSNIVKELNRRGLTNIVVVDNLTNSQKTSNLSDLIITDYYDKIEFAELLKSSQFDIPLEAVFHQGACTNTMEYDGRYMVANNFGFSKLLLEYCQKVRVPMVYASSAAVYGNTTFCKEEPSYERPLNVYGYSKLLFDQHVRSLQRTLESPVTGLRYFNVFGPREAHKGRMASMVSQLYHQLANTGEAKLFEATDGYGDGEQQRDFISVHDVVSINLFFGFDQPQTGIFNAGTGVSRSFNDIAKTLIKLRGCGIISYIPFPSELKGKYQSYTQADISSLRNAGYKRPFLSLEEGISFYYSFLKAQLS